jgi:Ni,Fe-hydrogenase I cytochrome b subunit
MLPDFGGIQNIRLIHHPATWYFIFFTLLHVLARVDAVADLVAERLGHLGHPCERNPACTS